MGRLGREGTVGRVGKTVVGLKPANDQTNDKIVESGFALRLAFRKANVGLSDPRRRMNSLASRSGKREREEAGGKRPHANSPRAAEATGAESVACMTIGAGADRTFRCPLTLVSTRGACNPTIRTIFPATRKSLLPM